MIFQWHGQTSHASKPAPAESVQGHPLPQEHAELLAALSAQCGHAVKLCDPDTDGGITTWQLRAADAGFRKGFLVARVRGHGCWTL